MSAGALGVQSETGWLRRVLVKPPTAAFASIQRIATEWHELGYTAAPHLERASVEHAHFLDLLVHAGAEVIALPDAAGTGLDSLYARDSSIACARGLILASMGKPARSGEPHAVGASARALGIPVCGSITGDGRIEGGDVLWLDPRTLVVGRGYRTNDEGIRQLRALLADEIDELIVVPLPHWHGPGECLHLMSLLSPVDRDLAVVYSPLLSVPFRETLCARGIGLVEVPTEELASQGTNVLTLGPRHCVMLAGNPRTRAALERAGCVVEIFEGHEICAKGSGGPTCLARPLLRDPPG
jgi:N-dimethylarginine dimethylaminohydrolase